ncbi:MAG TPA: tetratricopeptide repeat protein [Gemmataceae bacterium]|nr:tetratricopeptide repeat protein [Gemmataceae bacterium]
MRWLQTEYLLKGIYLGLLVFAALAEATAPEPDWTAPLRVTLDTVGGLTICLVIAAWIKLRQGYRARGQWPAFILFLLLESPTLVYTGILLGMAVGAFTVRGSAREGDEWLLSYLVGGGAVLGVLFGVLQAVRRRWVRAGLSLALAVGLVAALLYGFGYRGQVLGFTLDIRPQVSLENPALFGTQLLLGMPIFYLLTFAGRREESEVEIGVICAGLGFATLMLIQEWEHRQAVQSLPFLVPVILYFFYTMRVLPGLRVFKHVLRGLSYLRVGRWRLALLSFRRALQLDPNNRLARESFWNFHLQLDFDQLSKDPEMLALVDFNLCLERAGSLLLEAPTPAKLHEAHRLLDLVASQKPALQPAVDYWRAVAATHARQYEQAAGHLVRLLDPSCYGAADEQRRAMLLPAWQLALTLHPELRRLVGVPQLGLPGRRMEAIAAVERRLREDPGDAGAWNLKRLLYQDLTEADFDAAAAGARPAPGEPPVADFDYEYTAQLGQALIGDAVRWQRGAEYLRIAARGLPAQGPSLFVQIAQACQRAGDGVGAWRHYELAKQAGRAIGPANLSPEERQAYFGAVKLLAEAAHRHGELDTAIENYHLYTEYERAGVETLRALADLYERKGDPLSALRVTDRALVYNPSDKDLLERKDRYYYSVQPQDLQARLETFQAGFDVDYCLKKAKALLDMRNADLDLIDWAQHLVELARVIQPDRLAPRLLLARAHLRRGEKEEAIALLESIRTPKPEKFASAEDEEAWFTSCRLLGELYLEQGRPDLAVPCFNEYRKSPKSGADTMYKLGQAYEQLGDFVRARKCYEHVTAYDGHPLAPEARDALYRLQSS